MNAPDPFAEISRSLSELGRRNVRGRAQRLSEWLLVQFQFTPSFPQRCLSYSQTVLMLQSRGIIDENLASCALRLVFDHPYNRQERTVVPFSPTPTTYTGFNNTNADSTSSATTPRKHYNKYIALPGETILLKSADIDYVEAQEVMNYFEKRGEACPAGGVLTRSRKRHYKGKFYFLFECSCRPATDTEHFVCKVECQAECQWKLYTAEGTSHLAKTLNYGNDNTVGDNNGSSSSLEKEESSLAEKRTTTPRAPETDDVPINDVEKRKEAPQHHEESSSKEPGNELPTNADSCKKSRKL